MGTSLDLPQLVVVGGQSSGKSSVLENLVGKDFLPRGTGICTRRPLILQLSPSSSTEPWGSFAHLPNKKFTDFHEIRREIERETERVAGTGKAVSKEPIILHIHSADVLPLTLVDTPGMTRVPVGDQPSDIEHQIRDMVHSIVQSKNAIILAVHPANQDIATSDGLKIAREVDPKGLRTIGVLTKLDLMDTGTNPLNLLMGRTLPLRLGFVGVVNRSQKDISEDMPISDSLKQEEKFFKSNPIYREVHDRCGTSYLAQKCSRVLAEQIRVTLPEVQTNIRNRIDKVKAELEELGEPVNTGGSDKRWMALQILNHFTTKFREAIEGTRADITSSTLHGGARIRYIFDDIYRKKLLEIKSDECFSTEQYRLAIRNAAGPRPSLIIPQGAFEVLTKKQIEVLRDPSLQCAELILGELQRIAAILDFPELARFPRLQESVVEVACKVLGKGLKPAQKMISDLIDCELAYINTNHPDFLGSAEGTLLTEGLTRHAQTVKPQRPASSSSGGFFSRLFGSGTPQSASKGADRGLELPQEAFQMDKTVSSREQVQISLIKELLDSYFNIARKNVQDGTTKAIWHFLVNKGVDELHRALVTEIYSHADVDSLLSESEEVSRHREQLRVELETLKEAKRVLQRVEWPQ